MEKTGTIKVNRITNKTMRGLKAIYCLLWEAIGMKTERITRKTLMYKTGVEYGILP
jgi:hypothetical protein